jgi:IS605 OrfB family transposase
MHPPDQPEVRRLDRKRQGSYAARLLRHLDGLRDDRAKTTADHIIQAARGLAYIEGRWEPRHPPADVIVLEDLERYRFKTDRPRSENSLLMRWSHREVTRRVEEQAEVYGIAVADTGAAFSSRFDAVTGAPGLRCEQVSHATLQFLGSPAGVFEQQRLDRMGINWRSLCLGDLRPRDGGELVVALDGPERLRTKHADINAAQNIGVRYLTAHAAPVRLRVSKVPGGDNRQLVSYELGLLAEAALGGKRILFTATDGPTYSARAFKTGASLLTHLKQTTDAGVTFDGNVVDDSDDDDELAESQALLDATSAETLTLFRDPSGHLFAGMWCEAKVFWGRVRQEIISRLRRTGRLHG